MEHGGDACKTLGEEGGTMVSGESGGMGLRGVTGGVGVGTEHRLEDNLYNSQAQEVQMSREHCRRDDRSLHWRVGIQAQVRTEPQTWTPSAWEAAPVSSSCRVYEHSAMGHRSMLDENRNFQS